jgi:hypothetical protein
VSMPRLRRRGGEVVGERIESTNGLRPSFENGQESVRQSVRSRRRQAAGRRKRRRREQRVLRSTCKHARRRDVARPRADLARIDDLPTVLDLGVVRRVLKDVTACAQGQL